MFFFLLIIGGGGKWKYGERTIPDFASNHFPLPSDNGAMSGLFLPCWAPLCVDLLLLGFDLAFFDNL